MRHQADSRDDRVGLVVKGSYFIIRKDSVVKPKLINPAIEK